MFELKNSCKGWARMQAQITKKKQKYVSYRFDYTDRYSSKLCELAQCINLNDPKLLQWEVDAIRSFDPKKEYSSYRCPEAQIRYRMYRIFLRQRLEKFSNNDVDAYECEYDSYLRVYLQNDNYDEFEKYIGEVHKEVKAVTGVNFILKETETSFANVPKSEPLAKEFEYDQYGNKFEIGDFIARSQVGRSGTFADVIIGTTEKSLALLSGGNCDPRSTFVVKKGTGNTIYMY